MDFMVDNWFLFIVLIAAIGCIIVSVCDFGKMPSEDQLKKVKEWLKYAVAAAEKELGSGTGQLKLRFVYDMFVQRFGWLAKCITFEQFSLMVDESLEWLNVQLSSNDKMKELVNEGK